MRENNILIQSNLINCFDDVIKEKNCSKNILIVLNDFKKGGLEKHTIILEKEFNTDICVMGVSERKNVITYNDQLFEKYKVVIFQNTFFEINKKGNQKYIYIVHSQCNWWGGQRKNIVKKNNKFIDVYIFVSDIVKTIFETNVIKVTNGYVIENRVSPIKNDKHEILGLYISCGSYNELKGHYRLIKEFSKLNKENNKLEIYGDIHDIYYYNKLRKYIDNNNLYNIKLYEYTNNYIERLKEAEYFCLFSRSEGCSYAILEAIALNKKIIFNNTHIMTEQLKRYPKKLLYTCHFTFEPDCINYSPYSIDYFIQSYRNIIHDNDIE